MISGRRGRVGPVGPPRAHSSPADTGQRPSASAPAPLVPAPFGVTPSRDRSRRVRRPPSLRREAKRSPRDGAVPEKAVTRTPEPRKEHRRSRPRESCSDRPHPRQRDVEPATEIGDAFVLPARFPRSGRSAQKEGCESCRREDGTQAECCGKSSPRSSPTPAEQAAEKPRAEDHERPDEVLVVIEHAPSP
jgi:hypothetical protein